MNRSSISDNFAGNHSTQILIYECVEFCRILQNSSSGIVWTLVELQHTSATIVYRLGSRLPRSSKNPGVLGDLGESGVVGLMGTEGKSTPERLIRRGWTRISCTSPTETEGMTKNRLSEWFRTDKVDVLVIILCYAVASFSSFFKCSPTFKKRFTIQ